VHALVGADADDDTLRTVARSIREALEALEDVPRRTRAVPDFDAIMRRDPPTGAGEHAMADRAVGGYANPTSVVLEPSHDGDDVVATVVFGPAFEGGLGRVHGGLVAAVFDDLMGYVLAIVREPAFTGRLTVNYKAPVPMETPVEFRARLRERQGRKLFVDAECCLGEQVLATAEILFVTVAQEHFATHASKLLDIDRAAEG
jgi:acyl-coenzyme A thioesterase PaaI-like protein